MSQHARSKGELEAEGAMKRYKIALIAGDGIGQEVVPEGVRVLDEAGRRFGISFDWDPRPWGCEHYVRTGAMMPPGALDGIRHHDAIFLGAVGFVGVPDHISLWGLLIQTIREPASDPPHAQYHIAAA
jgi:tartrate dehydrogenase/decarboxylase / D-malate dehydrogenase